MTVKAVNRTIQRLIYRFFFKKDTQRFREFRWRWTKKLSDPDALVRYRSGPYKTDHYTLHLNNGGSLWLPELYINTYEKVWRNDSHKFVGLPAQSVGLVAYLRLIRGIRITYNHYYGWDFEFGWT